MFRIKARSLAKGTFSPRDISHTAVRYYELPAGRPPTTRHYWHRIRRCQSSLLGQKIKRFTEFWNCPRFARGSASTSISIQPTPAPLFWSNWLRSGFSICLAECPSGRQRYQNRQTWRLSIYQCWWTLHLRLSYSYKSSRPCWEISTLHSLRLVCDSYDLELGLVSCARLMPWKESAGLWFLGSCLRYAIAVCVELMCM
jgi:hypothetical protein